MTQLIFYTSENGQAQVQLRAYRGTVWLTQLEMAELFNARKQHISLHLNNIYQDCELDTSATVKESLTVQTDGAREMRRTVTFYNRGAILAVGYRVRSPRGVQFRRWASMVLAEYLRKGFVTDYDQRREAQEAQAADEQDEAELKALESRIKDRKRTGHDCP